jgi:inorganic pyrophosphatase
MGMDGSSRADFWARLEELVASSKVVIDRPKGSAHPRYPDFIYPHDYGFLENTSAADGNPIEVWVGSRPDRRLGAIVCTVDVLKRDTEIKLLLGCTPADVRDILAVHDSQFMSGILVERPLR